MRSAAPTFRQDNRSRRGAAAVEFALILPLLVTLVLACVDFGQFAYNYIAVTNAARALRTAS
jgi:Flp pilus assembly protein TadG